MSLFFQELCVDRWPLFSSQMLNDMFMFTLIIVLTSIGEVITDFFQSSLPLLVPIPLWWTETGKQNAL